MNDGLNFKISKIDFKSDCIEISIELFSQWFVIIKNNII